MPAVFKVDDAPFCGRYFDIGSSNVQLCNWVGDVEMGCYHGGRVAGDISGQFSFTNP